MNLDALLAEPPSLHWDGQQFTWAWKLADSEVRSLAKMLRPGMKTLETGAGLSTIVFAMCRTDHTVIVPDQGLVDRIVAWCAEHGVDTSGIRFLVEPSETALPRLFGSEGGYDLALIDGSHIFPMPFVDWFYMAGLLKVGGVVIIDDLHIWTCDVLVQFLVRDPAWQVVEETASAGIFRKLAGDITAVRWEDQPFVAARSRATSLAGKLGYATSLLARGRFGYIANLLSQKAAARLNGTSGRR